MTGTVPGICPICGWATEDQHVGKARIPVEFCPRCNAVVGGIHPANRPVHGHRPDPQSDAEYTRESLDNARSALAESVKPRDPPPAA